MESIQQINVSQLKSRLAQAGDRPLLLDVREAWEYNLCALPGSVHIPMGQIQARLNEIDRNREIVVVCHHGVRSNQVAHYLATAMDGGSTENAGAISSAHQGYAKLYNLSGGIDAWAREIDPNMRIY